MPNHVNNIDMEDTLTTELAAFVAELKALEIKRVDISYFGDDGEGLVESTNYIGPNNDRENLDRDMEDFIYRVLDSECSAWDDEAGSYGVITIYPPIGYILIDHAQHLKDIKRYQTQIQL